MLITRDVLAKLGVSGAAADTHLEPLNAAMAAHGIDTSLRIAHFLAQVVHESGHFRHVVENMNYSADRLIQVFPRYFPNRELAQSYAGKPEKIGSRVYGARMGNRAEASGDGYRYRGRGLLQLTGRSNYQAFSDWAGSDVLSDPDQVASRFAPHSAVFYWDTRKLNRLADTDDIRQLTRAVNGGLNGFAERRELLEKARDALRDVAASPGNSIAPDTSPFKPGHRVVPPQLNLRTAPRTSPATWMATLDEGSEVQVVGGADRAGWVRVRVILNGVMREGYVADTFLAPLPVARTRGAGLAARRLPVSLAVQAHLQQNRPDITRKRAGGWAYPLGEAGRPRRSGAKPQAKAEQLLAIVEYLDSAAPAHARYQPRGGTTYCNIYACDYCYLAGVYLPRVWWTDLALQRLATGEVPAAAYGQTVRELNANALHDWLDDHGTHFGWHREFDLTTLQAAANAGEACLIVGKRQDLNRSGHIVAVVPESPGFKALRDAALEVLRPVESQAGVNNFQFAVNRTAWWRNGKFQSYAFWRHP